MVPFQAEKGQNSSKKWCHLRKGSKFVNKNGTISVKKVQNSSTKNDTISDKFQNSLTKMITFLKRVKFLNKNGTISENG